MGNEHTQVSYRTTMYEDQCKHQIEQIWSKLVRLESEVAALRGELTALTSQPTTQPQPPEQNAPQVPVQAQVGTTSAPAKLITPQVTQTPNTPNATVDAHSPLEDKIALFCSRFAGREDVYAYRWVSAKTGKKGWSPAVRSGFSTGHETPDDYLPLTAEVIQRHLRRTDYPGSNEFHAGLYPLTLQDTCHLLVCDFDDGDWRDDAATYTKECVEAGLTPLAEISRSGEGAHVWLFFAEAVAARAARSLGLRLLRKAMAKRPGMSMRSYDRFFPSQDVLPTNSTGRGQFGNLIALPLEGDCRKRGTTVFADPTTWEPLDDQFAALANTELIPIERVLAYDKPTTLQLAAGPAHDLGARPPKARIRALRTSINGQKISLHLGGMLSVPTADVPGPVISELKHMASIANPEFYRRQNTRQSTFGIPRLVVNFESEEGVELRLPRGLLDETTCLLREAGFKVSVRKRFKRHTKLDMVFTGTLRPEQEQAVDKAAPHATGVIVAPPGAGKTVMACALIAKRKVPTAILVPRKELLHQWRAALQQFLNVCDKDIGQLGGGRKKRTGKIDLIMVPSLAHRNGDPTVLEEYGQIVIDECHCVPAPATVAALSHIKVEKWLGLTATPFRADRMDGIITMQCGPIRQQIHRTENVRRELITHETDFTTEEPGTDGPSIQAIYSELVSDTARNSLIVKHVCDAAKQGRTILVLTNRLAHMDALVVGLREAPIPVFQLHGRLPQDQRTRVRKSALAAGEAGEPFILVAMDKIAGEGLDLPALDTLFLTVPISFKGRVIQQLGRVTRGNTHGMVPVAHDFHDAHVPLLDRMYMRRHRVMKNEGFVPVA